MPQTSSFSSLVAFLDRTKSSISIRLLSYLVLQSQLAIGKFCRIIAARENGALQADEISTLQKQALIKGCMLGLPPQK